MSFSKAQLVPKWLKREYVIGVAAIRARPVRKTRGTITPWILNDVRAVNVIALSRR